jgi:hypothetical protein
MARAKGSPKLGGRKKGTPNKNTAPIKAKVSQLLSEYSLEQMKSDLDSISPSERLKIVSGLIGFVLPKKQTEGINYEIRPIQTALYLQDN